MEARQPNGTTPSLPLPRLIPHVVSEHARTLPNKTWGAIPRHITDASQGYEDISFARLNYAVSRAATWLGDEIEPHQLRKFEALAYLGPPDSRYIIFAIAAIKAGFQMLFLSPRNSDEAQESVIEQANCQKFLCSESMKDRVDKLLQSRPRISNMHVYVVPKQEELLKDEFVPDFSYEKTLEEARSDPLVVLHTSSTTGIPKTIHLNQGYGLHEDIVQHVPEHAGLDIITRKPFYGDCRMFVAMPLFHAGGVLLTLLKSLYHDIVSVFQPPSAALNSEVFDAILRHGNCNGCVIPPYLLEDMLPVPSYFDTLANLKFVQFGSGPLSQAAGKQLLTRQKNCPHFIGSSECGLYILLELDDPVRDWQYFRFHPWSGVEMRPLGDDSDTREMYIMRTEAGKIPGIQPVFELFPDLNEWPTRDLYVRHPTKPDHWRCIGRNDDVLVLSNGEKLNPVDTEGRLANVHPSITAALVIGQGQFAPALLLEVKDVDTKDPSKRSELIEAIWPAVRAANKEAPGHGQLNKSLILFTSLDKPFLRTPKLSIRRKPTIDSYAKEIEDMYNSFGNDSNETSVGEASNAPKLDALEDVQGLIKRSIESIAEWETMPETDSDLFAFGMDSLQVARLSREVKRALRGRPEQESFNARIIYSNPSISGMSKAIFELLHEKNAGVDHSVGREVVIEQMIEKYSKFKFGSITVNGHGEDREDNGSNVILTGSTGSLGSYLLLTLLSNPSIRHIFCLNRSKSARQRQLDVLESQGVNFTSIPNFDKVVHFMHTDSLRSPNLGLSNPEEFESLQKAGITHIIHNAWPVNFNLSLASFEPHIAGVRALIDFSSSIPRRPKLIFVSSLSSVTALSTRTKVVEEIILDPSAPANMGYGESKYVAERILHNATEASQGSMATSILRVGQIAGPVKGSTGVWPTQEWFPSLVISSKTIGALPDSLGRMNSIDWIPVDVLAECIRDLVANDGSASKGKAQMESMVYHVLNQKTVLWPEILPTALEETGVEKIVPLAEWIDLVRSGPDETEIGTPNPAKKIQRFYEALQEDAGSGMVVDPGRTLRKRRRLNDEGRFEVRNMAKRSRTFKKLEPVNEAWMSKWIKQWF